MQRRDFIKLSAITGATAALDGCGQPDVQLIRFIREEELTPGVATWKPSICTLCPAGCGTLVKVMEGDAEVIRNGKLGLMKMGLAKKIEGNPKHPVSQGKLCPRGQAMLQVTYHPDRIKHPLKRTGPRGSGQFQEISWDEAIKELVAKLQELQAAKQQASLAFLTKPLRGQGRELIERFLGAYGAPPPVMFELFDESVLRRANALSFGRPQLPTLDLARSNYVLSFGADFLGTWNSPVAQSIAYGQMRQGRPGQRGKFVMVEPRLSQTGANADEWIYARPATEGALALGLAHVILREKLRRPEGAGRPGDQIPGWLEGREEFPPEKIEMQTGVPTATIVRLAREMATHPPAVAVAGDAPLAQTNGLRTALAVNALNALLGSVEQPGGILFTPLPKLDGTASGHENSGLEGAYPAFSRLASRILEPYGMSSGVFSGSPRNAQPPKAKPQPLKALFLYEANPAFLTPADVPEILSKVPFIASFGSFVDETSVQADLILPDHSPLESWLDDIPESGTRLAVVSLAAPAVRPLHNTRAMPDTLLEIAHQLGQEVSKALPWKTYEEMLKEAYGGLWKQTSSIEATKADEFWAQIREQGGWWSSEGVSPSTRALKLEYSFGSLLKAEFYEEEHNFPFHFLPYPSQLLYDGSLAHLPWLQEAPDPLSTAMWGTWLEINPQTAARMGIAQGDLVEVTSADGKLQAPALLSPGIAPDVVAMPVGQGHNQYTRYATSRGANPVKILHPLVEHETGSLAWAATRVKISKIGEGKLALFGAELREHPQEHR